MRSHPAKTDSAAAGNGERASRNMHRSIRFAPLLIAAALVGCTPTLYLQQTEDVPKDRLVLLELAPSWKIGTARLTIDGMEIPKKKGLVNVYLLPGTHEIVEEATGIGKCLRKARVRYIDRSGNTVKTQLECRERERVRWTRKGELEFKAGYAYDFHCYLTMLPVVDGELDEAQQIIMSVCRSGKIEIRRKIGQPASE